MMAVANAECCGSPRPCGGGILVGAGGRRVIFSSILACSSKTGGQPPTFSCCGNGPCNIFCCNCDDGCIVFDSCPPLASPARRSVSPGNGRRPIGSKFAKVGQDLHDEVEVNVPATCPAHAASSYDCTRHKFDLLDSSIEKNGEITIQEFIAGWALVNPHFSDSLWEDPDTYIQAVEHFKRFDTNGDNVLSFSETWENRF